jgi:hypothetical protein
MRINIEISRYSIKKFWRQIRCRHDFIESNGNMLAFMLPGIDTRSVQCTKCYKIDRRATMVLRSTKPKTQDEELHELVQRLYKNKINATPEKS